MKEDDLARELLGLLEQSLAVMRQDIVALRNDFMMFQIKVAQDAVESRNKLIIAIITAVGALIGTVITAAVGFWR